MEFILRSSIAMENGSDEEFRTIFCALGTESFIAVKRTRIFPSPYQLPYKSRSIFDIAFAVIVKPAV